MQLVWTHPDGNLTCYEPPFQRRHAFRPRYLHPRYLHWHGHRRRCGCPSERGLRTMKLNARHP